WKSMSTDRSSGSSIASSSPGWGQELRTVWQGLPNRAVFFCLLAAWLALFHFLGNSTLGYVNTSSLFYWWLWVMTGGDIGRDGLSFSKILGGDEAHAWFVPGVVLVLLWWKRKELLELPQRVWWPALALLAFGLLVHILGYSV